MHSIYNSVKAHHLIKPDISKIEAPIGSYDFLFFKKKFYVSHAWCVPIKEIGGTLFIAPFARVIPITLVTSPLLYQRVTSVEILITRYCSKDMHYE